MKRTLSGFTLLELLISLTISALLLGAGIPSLSQLLANNKADNIYQQLFTLVQFTRIQSINYQSQVILCPSSNQQDCISDWNQELMVFVDLNNDEERNDDELLLQIHSPLEDNEVIKWNASGSKRYLRFKSDGSTRNQNGRLTYCLYRGDDIYARQIIMYKTGRARKASKEEAEEKC